MPSRAVILRHALPDGSWHRDWLIEPPDLPARPSDDDSADLVAFRLPPGATPPGDPGAPAFECERLPPHRRRYLRYRGPLSGNRGTVAPEAELLVRWESLTESQGVLWTVHPTGERRWRGTGRPDGRWEWTPEPA
ncbi:MAG: hypothetical protein FJ255_12095 [Phycisphaerae bacterium]|nr:hypothetical protein [Phycisphaerae bacterium]